MTEILPDCGTIEEAYRVTRAVVKAIPENTETRRALDHLEFAERYTMEAREAVRPARADEGEG